MYKNFFVLNRHVLELNRLLSGCMLQNCYTQEKNKIIFNFQCIPKEYFVEVSTDPLLPYIVVKDKFNRAKKNTLNFFESYLPSKLKSIKIAKLDRVIQIKLLNAALYFFIRGKETNVFLIDNDGRFDFFKKYSDEKKLFDQVSIMEFIDSYQIPKIVIEPKDDTPSTMAKKYPFLGKEIIGEYLKIREENTNISDENIFNSILRNIELEKPFVYKAELDKVFKLSFFSLEKLKLEIVKTFETINNAINYLIIQNYKYNLKNKVEKNKELIYKKRIMKLERKLSHLQARAAEDCKEKYYQQIANLLSLNADNIKRGVQQFVIQNIYDSDKNISIDLNPKLNIRENIEYYFNKAKSERKEFDKLKILINDIHEEIEKLKVKSAEKKVTEIENMIKGDKKKSTDISKSKFRQFLIGNKYLILVGKNSKNNDELTTSFAKQNDYWFHARSVSGSHLVLRYDKSIGEIPKNILEKAASIAAYYSKAKASGLVPVSYTQRKYVVKRKGMEPGKVYLLKEKVLIVKPEIPKDCKIINDE